MASELVFLDSVDSSDGVADPKPLIDANSNDIYGVESLQDSVESGYGAEDVSSHGAGSLAGSVLSLSEAPNAAAAPTEEERQAWLDEMAKINEEAATLRLVLQAKIRRATDLKRNLGITQMDEFKSEVNSALKNIQESSAYAKTTATLQTVSQKTNAAVTSAVEAFRGAVNESTANPGPEKVSNSIFRDATGKIYVTLNTTGNYVAQTVESVKSSQAAKAVGASVNSTWAKLKARVVGGEPAPTNDSFVGDVVGTEPSTE